MDEMKFIILLEELFESDEDEFGKEFFCSQIVQGEFKYSSGVIAMIHKVKVIV